MPCEARIVAVGALVALGGSPSARAGDLGVPLEYLCRMPGRLWGLADCPLCAAGVPLDDIGRRSRESVRPQKTYLSFAVATRSSPFGSGSVW